MTFVLALGLAWAALQGLPRLAAADSSAALSSDLGRSSAVGHSTDIANLDYYPHARELLFTPQFSTALSDQSYSGNPTNSTGVSTVSTSTATLTAAYGLTNRLRISLVESALIGTNSTHLNTVSNATTMTSSSGLSDPTLGMNYRYLDDDAQSGFSADVGVSVSPSWVTHDIASSAQSGSDGKGYGTAALSAPVFWWVGHNEIEFSPAATREFVGNSVGTTLSSSNTRSAAWVGSLTLLDRFHVTDSLYFEAGGALDLPYSVQTTGLNAASSVNTSQYSTHLVPRFDLGYRATANVLFDAEYQYFNYSTQVIETSSTSQTIESTLAMKCMIQI